MKYKLSADEVLFYVNILCHKYKVDISNIKELSALFNKHVEIPISVEELTIILENPALYEETRLIVESYG